MLAHFSSYLIFWKWAASHNSAEPDQASLHIHAVRKVMGNKLCVQSFINSGLLVLKLLTRQAICKDFTLNLTVTLTLNFKIGSHPFASVPTKFHLQRLFSYHINDQTCVQSDQAIYCWLINFNDFGLFQKWKMIRSI